MSNIHSLVSEFASKIEALVEASVKERVDSVIAQVFPGSKRGPGRPRKSALAVTAAVKSAKRFSAAPSPARKRAMKRQGIYLGLLRSLTGSDRERVKSAAEANGVEAAIALGKKLKKKS